MAINQESASALLESLVRLSSDRAASSKNAGSSSQSGCVLCVPRLHASSQTREKGGRRNHISAVGFPKFCQDFAFFAPRELHVHRYQDRKHNHGDERRPLKQKPEYDEDEADILWVSYIGVRTRRRERMALLSFVEHFPSSGK